MKRTILLFIVSCVLTACLADSSGARESQQLLNEIPYYGLPALVPNRNIIHFLDCSVIPKNPKGELSALGFQLGKTTYQEMVEELQPANIYWNRDYGHLAFEEGGGWDNQKWGYAHACFSNGKLNALQISSIDEFPKNIEGFVAEFGVPDLVTWAGDIEERMAVWVELGLVGSFTSGAGSTETIFIIPPMKLSRFEGSWLSERIQYKPDFYDLDLNLIFYNEDPWGYTTDD